MQTKHDNLLPIGLRDAKAKDVCVRLDRAFLPENPGTWGRLSELFCLPYLGRRRSFGLDRLGCSNWVKSLVCYIQSSLLAPALALTSYGALITKSMTWSGRLTFHPSSDPCGLMSSHSHFR